VFFSFTYYHQNIFSLSSKQLAGELLPAELVAKIIPSVEKSIEAADAYMAKRILQGDTRVWFLAVDTLIKAARESVRQTAVNPPSNPPEAVPLDVAGAAKALFEARDQFAANPTSATMGAAIKLCKIVLTGVIQTNINVDLPPNFDCEPQRDTRELLTARERLLAGRASFAKACAFDGSKLQSDIKKLSKEVRVNTTSPGNALLEARDLVLNCIYGAKVSGLSEIQFNTVLQETERFIRSESLERNKFELARSAFWSATPDATMALAIAIVQGTFILVLVLLAGIFKRPPRIDSPLA
jgi:hypothetical protein